MSSDSPPRELPAPEVGVIGLGNLGLPLALALLDAGWSVTVVDPRAEPVEQCTAQGATAASEPIDLRDCHVVAVVVPDDETVTGVLVESGLLDALAPGSVVALHSTLLPQTVVELEQRAAAGDVRLTDAPVSGGAERARAGTLTVMAGGSDETIAAARDYFGAVADQVVHVGRAGSGAAAKLGNQLMMFAALAATYEALEIGAAFGVDQDALLRAVSSSTGDCWIAREWGFFDRTALQYDKTGVPLAQRPWSKDLWDVVAAGRSRQLRLPVAGLLSQLMPDRVEAHAHAGGDA